MSVSIIVKQVSKEGLRERTYRFIALEGLNFQLDSFTLTVRETKRHQPKLREIYNRIRVNKTYIGVTEHLQPPEVPRSVVRAFYRKVREQAHLRGYDNE